MIDQQDIEKILAKAVRLKGHGECLFRDRYSTMRGVGTSVRVDGVPTPMRLHQAIYRFYHGPIPTGLVVRHLCGYSGCCNYKHLWVGTQGDNCRDIEFHRKYGRGVLAPKSYD